MKFWSSLQKEYDELFGQEENEKQDNQDKSEKATDFENMFTDIKQDLKKFPKEDLLPGLAPIPEGSDSEVEDGEFDEEDARKALKFGEAKKKRGRKCKVGDKSYDVGERWKDPVTGKDMICILMNVPKDVQPKLAQADVTITKEEASTKHKPEEPSLKPKSSGSQWAYTNKQPKSRGCPSDKESEKPDQVGSEEERDANYNQEEQGDDFGGVNPLESNLLDKQVETIEEDNSVEYQTGEEAGNTTELSEKDSLARQRFGKESDDNSEGTGVGNDGASERLEISNREGGDEDSETDTDSEEEKRRVEKRNQNSDDSEYEEREEDKMKYTGSNKPEISVTPEDRETSVVQEEGLQDETESIGETPEGEDGTKKEKIPTTTDSQKSDTLPASEEIIVNHEKGKTIYTKETTVTQRKLFKTSETIESVETEKKID